MRLHVDLLIFNNRLEFANDAVEGFFGVHELILVTGMSLNV
jgi:hypothetical protein